MLLSFCYFKQCISEHPQSFSTFSVTSVRQTAGNTQATARISWSSPTESPAVPLLRCTEVSVVSHYGSEACRLLWTVQIISGSLEVALGVVVKQYSWTVNSREIMSKRKYRGTQEREKNRARRRSIVPRNHRQQDRRVSKLHGFQSKMKLL